MLAADRSARTPARRSLRLGIIVAARTKERPSMPKIEYRNVNEYIARYPDTMRSTLRSVRAAIQKAIPRA
jgi:hypothetical protein